MEYESLTRALQLVEILAEGQFLTVAQMAERSRLHPRRVYRLLETFPRVGLTLERQSHSYRLRADAPFLKRVTSFLHFTPDEVLTLRQILTAVPNSSVQARLLREKLERSTSENLFIPPDVDEVTGRNIRTMFEAIEGERIVSTTRVALRLGVLAKSVLLDEYPQAERRLTQEDDSHWLWEDEFCSMKGVGRFVMGLLEDIEIVDAPELEDYIREQISQAATRFMK